MISSEGRARRTSGLRHRHPAYAIESERAKLYAFLVGPDICGNGAPVRHIHLHIRGRRAPAGLLFEIDIGELLAGTVLHDEASIVEFFNRPWWWEAASGGFGLRLAFAS